MEDARQVVPVVLAGVSAQRARAERLVVLGLPPRVPRVEFALGLLAPDRGHSAAGAARRLPSEARREPAAVRAPQAVRVLSGGDWDDRGPAPRPSMEARGVPSARVARRVRVEALEPLDPDRVPRVRRDKIGGASAETPASAALRHGPARRGPASRVRPEWAAPERQAMAAGQAASLCRDRCGAERAGPQVALLRAQAPVFERTVDLVERPPRVRSRCRVR